MDPHVTAPTPGAGRPGRLAGLAAAWERFWFTPGDPTVLAVVRICTGLIVVFTMFTYTLDLQEMVGTDAWFDLTTSQEWYREAAQPPVFLGWAAPFQPPANPEQEEYMKEYQKEFREMPPGPQPKSAAEARSFIEFRHKWGVDARLVSVRGQPAWSIWFHVTDPDSMMAVQLGILAVCVLFTLGLGTRLTAVLTWLAWLSFMHRNPIMLFGADFIVAVVLLYLMIGPSGDALSLDRLLARGGRGRGWT